METEAIYAYLNEFMLKLRLFKLGMLAPIASVMLWSIAYLVDPSALRSLRNATFDQFQRWQPRQYQAAPVRIIDIDEASLLRLGQWPWPRTRLAELLLRLQDEKPAVVVFDFVFPEPDRTSPYAMSDLWQLPIAVRQQLMLIPDHDTAFASAIQKGPVVLGLAAVQDTTHAQPSLPKARYITFGEEPKNYVPHFPSSVSSLPVLEQAATGIGAISFIPDLDGVVRKAPLMIQVDRKLVPSLAAEALRVSQGEKNYTIRTESEKGVGLTALGIGSVHIPTTTSGEVWIHYTKTNASRYIPAWKVLNHELKNEDLSGNILLIGTSAQGLMDLRFSPLGGTIPGVEVHAQLLEQVLLGKGLSRPSWSAATEVLIVLGGGLLVAGVTLASGAITSAVLTFTLVCVLWTLAWFAFSRYGLLLDPATLTLSFGSTFLFGSIVRHFSSEKRTRWIRQAFARYVSPNLVAYILKQPEALELGGRRQLCSFVFTDLSDFTTLMESLDPAKAVKLINDYLDGMIAIAFAYQGTLDRIVGDSVAIMFSAPLVQEDHQQRALACAAEMQVFASRYVTKLAADGYVFGQTRIGVHTGEVIVGNFGGGTIFDYRALGDPVSTASRLEGANKYLGTRLCASEATLVGCPEWPVRPIGRVLLKGKQHPLSLFEPLSAEHASIPDLDYQRAFDAMHAGHHEAEAMFEALVKERPADRLVALHLQRLKTGESGDLIVLTDK